MLKRRTTWVAALMFLAVIGLTSCGGSSPHASTTSCESGGSAISLIPTAERSPAGSWGTAPTVQVPPGAPPAQLECAQLITGSGPASKSGDTMTMQYVLASYSSRGVVQSSWTSQAFTFVLGETSLIPGWVTGVTGMQAGSRRELIVPPAFGYGDLSPGAGIAKNDTLVFVFDLQKLN